jgi:hypothetical protein
MKAYLIVRFVHRSSESWGGGSLRRCRDDFRRDRVSTLAGPSTFSFATEWDEPGLRKDGPPRIFLGEVAGAWVDLDTLG